MTESVKIEGNEREKKENSAALGKVRRIQVYSLGFRQ
jgi:hypothetical protein